MMTEKVLLDVAICKLSRNPSKNNIKKIVDNMFSILDQAMISEQLQPLRHKVEKALISYFANVSHKNVDPTYVVDKLTRTETAVIKLLISNGNIIMANLDHLPDARKKAVAVKIIFSNDQSTLILPISEEYKLDEYINTDGLKTSDMRKWYYIDSKDITHQGPISYKHYPVATLTLVE